MIKEGFTPNGRFNVIVKDNTATVGFYFGENKQHYYDVKCKANEESILLAKQQLVEYAQKNTFDSKVRKTIKFNENYIYENKPFELLVEFVDGHIKLFDRVSTIEEAKEQFDKYEADGVVLAEVRNWKWDDLEENFSVVWSTDENFKLDESEDITIKHHKSVSTLDEEDIDNTEEADIQAETTDKKEDVKTEKIKENDEIDENLKIDLEEHVLRPRFHENKNIVKEDSNTSLKNLVDGFDYNGPNSSEDPVPSAVPNKFNQINIPDRMRTKYFDVSLLNRNTIEFTYITQEDFNKNDAKVFRKEFIRYIKELTKEFNIIIPFKINVDVRCRNGWRFGEYKDIISINNSPKNNEGVNTKSMKLKNIVEEDSRASLKDFAMRLIYAIGDDLDNVVSNLKEVEKTFRSLGIHYVDIAPYFTNYISGFADLEDTKNNVNCAELLNRLNEEDENIRESGIKNESIDFVKKYLSSLKVNNTLRSLKNDEKAPKGFSFKSGTGREGEVNYNGIDYAWAIIPKTKELKVMKSSDAGSNWSETIFKESSTKNNLSEGDHNAKSKGYEIAERLYKIYDELAYPIYRHFDNEESEEDEDFYEALMYINRNLIDDLVQMRKELEPFRNGTIMYEEILGLIHLVKTEAAPEKILQRMSKIATDRGVVRESFKVVDSKGKKVLQGGGFTSKEEAEMFAAQYGEPNLRVIKEDLDDIEEILKELNRYLAKHNKEGSITVKTAETKDIVVKELKDSGYNVEVSGNDLGTKNRFHIEYYMKNKDTGLKESKTILDYDINLAEYIYDNIDVNINRHGYLTFDEDVLTYENVIDNYDDRITRKAFNQTKSIVVKALQQDDLKFYTPYNSDTLIELSDNHTLWDINVPIDEEEYGIILEQYLEKFTQETGVEVFTEGRSGRHICVHDTVENLIRFEELQAIQQKLESEMIEHINTNYDK